MTRGAYIRDAYTRAAIERRAELAATNRPDATAWMRYANCDGLETDLFFPNRGEPIHEAMAICAACTVRRQCLAYALDTGQHYGIWGGWSEKRRRAHRARARARARERIA